MTANIKDILTRGVHDVYTSEELEKKLNSGKTLHIKLGTDVTGANLHLGHAVIHRKLRDFQELGHKVTLIIGDFTTLVGDHSDKVDMREETTVEKISEFEQHYADQFFKTVIKEQTEIRHNSEWLKPLNFNDILHLAKQFTISQMLDRETFLKRYNEQKPIGLDEFLYPLMQGYDSVALNCDVELGGTDQTFNLLAGRRLMEAFNQTPQNAIAMKLLLGSDGRPMGKSLKNFISITENPNDMFGKIMSIVDDVMWDYFELVTRVPMEEVAKMRQAVEKDGENPMNIKKVLARDIVTFYHSIEDALKAEQNFEKVVQNKEVDEETIIEVTFSKDPIKVLDMLKQTELGTKHSAGEIKRVVEQGGLEINGDKITDFNAEYTPKSGDIIKFGKREFLRIR